MKLMPLEERKGKKCYFCGTSLSVKYKVKITDPEEKEVHCCNRCVAIFTTRNSKND